MRSLVLWMALASGCVPVGAQTLAVGVIDVYGAQHVAAPALRAALGLAIGDTLGMDTAAALVKRAEQRLREVPGVARAKLHFTCCDAGRLIIYIGVAEAGSHTVIFRAAPTAGVRLPQRIVAAGDEFGVALMAAVRRGDTGENDSLGYALASDTAMRRIQRSFVSIAAAQFPLLREVLHGSRIASQRALAAQIIGYGPTHAIAGRTASRSMRR